MVYNSWDMMGDRPSFFSCWTNFCPLTPLATQKIRILKKWKNEKKKKKNTHTHTRKYHHFRQVEPKILIICYTVRETWHVTDVAFIFLFWAICCSFTHLTAQNMKISKKWKKHLEIPSFYTSIICYTVPEIWHVTDVTVIFHFGLFLSFYPHYRPKNENFKKMKKKSGRYYHFTQVYQKLWIDDLWFSRYGARRMDRQTDRQTEKVTHEVGAPPNKRYGTGF